MGHEAPLLPSGLATVCLPCTSVGYLQGHIFCEEAPVPGLAVRIILSIRCLFWHLGGPERPQMKGAVSVRVTVGLREPHSSNRSLAWRRASTLASGVVTLPRSHVDLCSTLAV